jgi:transposase
MAVMIGVDPHKGSHTAVAIDADELDLALVTVRAARCQVDEFVVWATRFEERTWAIESAGGLGYLLGQQLVAAGERVVDVPATLAARVRMLGGRSNKNDSNDALSVAVAALRAPPTRVGRSDHSGVLRLSAKRNSDLGRARNWTACRLHALLAELVAGGIPQEINARAHNGCSSRSRRRRRWNGRVTGWRVSFSRTCVASTTRCAPRSSASLSRSTSRAPRSPSFSVSVRRCGDGRSATRATFAGSPTAITTPRTPAPHRSR